LSGYFVLVIWAYYKTPPYVFVIGGVYRPGADFADFAEAKCRKSVVWTLVDSDNGFANDFNICHMIWESFMKRSKPALCGFSLCFVIYATFPAAERWPALDKDCFLTVRRDESMKTEIHQACCMSRP